MAAERIPANQIRSIFASRLTRDYVVLEVALYPDSGPLTVSPLDFLLRCGDQLIRPGTPLAMAARRYPQKSPHRSDLDVHPTLGIGYESSNDPYYGRRKGIYTTAGVEVGDWHDPAVGSTGRDRQIMEEELAERQLPESPVRGPVAGYLYFPIPANKQKNVAYELEWNRAAGRLRLSVR